MKRGRRRSVGKRTKSPRRPKLKGSLQRKSTKHAVRSKRRHAQQHLLPPRQVVVRAQELAFQLLVAIDREALVHRFLRWYANERGRPGRISNPGRYRELVETIRREAFLTLALQAEEEGAERLGGRSTQKMSTAHGELIKLFRDEFYLALGRSLDFSEDQFGEFCRDIELYRTLRQDRRAKSRSNVSVPAGPFVDRCGFLLDSPLLDQGRRAAAKFESELHATGSSVIRKVFSRRS